MPDRPNVLWIMSDQHNAKCTGWGEFSTEVHTPNLERLASTGTRFDRAFCQNPICTPSRMSYLTGQYPSNHGYYGLMGETPARDLPSLLSVASEMGYRTGAFGKIHTPSGFIEPHADVIQDMNGSNTPNNAFTDYLRGKGRLEDRDGGQLQEWAEKAGPDAIQALDARASRLPFEDHGESWSTDRAIDFMDGDDDEPFLAWLSFGRPHQVYTPAEEFWEQYPDATDIDLPPSVGEDAAAAGKPPHHATSDLDEETRLAVFEPRTYEALLRRKLKGYLGCVSEVDALVGRVLEFLESAGLREETIVIYCADHGDFAAEHGFPEKAPGISYDAITRVPFVWSWPGEIEAGAVVDDLVETVDVFPTLLSLLADRAAPSADGHDLSGYLTGEGETPAREYAITENPWAKCVRTEEQKLTIYPRGFFGEGSEEFLEFYDLEADRWERENLAGDRPEAVERHRRLLYEHAVTHRRPATTHPPIDGGDAPDGTVDPAAIRALLAGDGHRNYL
jgi:choline-sulfatase/uncharacterized sulfatase